MANDQDPAQPFMMLDDPFTGADQFAESSSSASSSSPQLADDMYLVGLVTANILCLRRYAGGFISGELVKLVRQPFNPSDFLAIQVFNLLNEEVGHIESSAARVLSPLMDYGIIMIQGVMPKMYWEGYIYEVPCQIHIFATIYAFTTVKSIIQTARLHFISANDPSLALPELPIVKEHVDAAVRRNVDEIFKVLGEKKALGTLDPPNAIIKSELLPHQKEGLWYLVQQEKAKYLPPCWEEIDGHFVNALANYSTESCPDPIRGGIFADEMGLGKTLTILSLVGFDKFVDLEEMEDIYPFLLLVKALRVGELATRP
ncbi:unnamed protein product [Cuscuta epithymum]|uniref:HIRAN domain-containing protein n=1 Tax=Cuscuta epithymum TaxID=186058 RepID=A0AAV0DMR4_9ASTE|nr:unnamed protein product [Cuscuta epithymum]